MQYEVLYHRDAPWRVGETKAERAARMASGAVVAFGECYPETYPGRVISLRSVADVESGKLPSLSNMADKDRPVAVMDLDDEQRQGVASRKMKVDGDSLASVNFNDRFGAVAVKLRDRHADPEQWELDEQARITTQETENETLRKDYARSIEEYQVLKDDFPRELHRWSVAAIDEDIPPSFPEQPKRPRFHEVYESSFDREARAITKALARTVTNTGTGFYYVVTAPDPRADVITGVSSQTVSLLFGGLGTSDVWIGGYVNNTTRSQIRATVTHTDGTIDLEGDLSTWAVDDVLAINIGWTTVQAALDQLFTDQGATDFASTQTVNIFDGTYTEDIVGNTNLQPTLERRLEVKAADGETAVTLTNSGLSGNVLTLGIQSCLVQGLTFNSTINGLYGLQINNPTGYVIDCTFVGSNGGRGAWIGEWGKAEDCGFTDCSIALITFSAAPTVIRCQMTGTGTGVHIGNFNAYNLTMDACVISGAAIGVLLSGATADDPLGSTRIDNNTFYDCAKAISDINGDGDDVLILRGRNNIFTTTNTADYAIHEPGILGSVDFDNNIYNGYTNPFHLEGTDLSLAEWQVEVDREGNSPDANSVEADPLLTDPGSGDFSLQDASPAKWAGQGSGVVTGINAVAFDPNHPDIGAWSSGVIPSPSWAADTSGIVATDSDSFGEVGLTWDEAAATVLTNLNKGYIVESRTVAGPGAYVEHGRTNGLSFTVGNLTDGVAREFRVTAFTRVLTEPSSVPTDTDTATPTPVDTPAAPVIAATDNGDQDSIDVDIVPESESDSTVVFYQGLTSGGLFEWPTPQVGTGTITLTGLLVQNYVIYAVATRGGLLSEPSNLAFVTVAAANQYTAFRNALREWVKGVVGDPEVIFRNPNAPQPARLYLSVHLNPSIPVGSDYHSGADTEGIETVEGDREYVFSVQVHGLPSDEDAAASVSVMERLRSSLEKRSIQASLSASGLAFVAVEGFGDLAGIGGTEFEARAFMDFRFRSTYEDTDDVGFVGTAVPVGTYE